jgi:UDPglucose--hexose-1-phosphate uridylyltransferase
MADTSLAPEYRRDPVTGRWVIFAPERSLRPLALSHSKPHSRWDAERDACPFCEGHETDTPQELLAYRDPGSKPNGPGWRLRVVPNRFPAVRPTAGTSPHAGPGGLFKAAPGVGTHELIIECPRHKSSPTAMTDAECANVFRAYRDRLSALAADPRFAYVTVFKNVGAEAGASLAHLHSQIVATPIIPEAVRQELDGAADYHLQEGRCVFCDLVQREAQAGVRVVAATPHFQAITAYAGRFAYETWVLPRSHESHYETITDAHAAELAQLIKMILGKLDGVLGHPAYNYYLHTAPTRSGPLAYYHWHLEIVPRTARPAGFEWGSGCFINAVLPEVAAVELRSAEPPPDDDIFSP